MSGVTPLTADTIGVVPNKPKTPVTTFRIPLDLKADAKAKAKERGEDLTAVVVRALQNYTKGAKK